MVLGRAWLVGLCVVGLGGCAATPKPDLPDATYKEFAVRWVGLNKCGRAGLLSPEAASLGLVYIESDLNKYSFDSARIDKEVAALERESVTAEFCNGGAMAVAARKRQIDQQNASVADSNKAWGDIIKANTPTRTYCNKIGTQTLCSTY